jgi:voltage-dependent calcium channel
VIATGLATSSAPPSPSLNPSDNYTVSGTARRRTSWGNRLDAGQDPLRPNTTPAASASSSSRMPSYTHADGAQSTATAYGHPEEPFYASPEEMDPVRPYMHDKRFPSLTSTSSMYSANPLAVSSAALIDEYGPEVRASDDEARLALQEADTERVAGSRQRARYSGNPSTLQKTGTVIKTVSQHLRRVSLRVVNLASSGLEDQVRLSDDEEERMRTKGKGKQDEKVPNDDAFSGLRKEMLIRGRTLGFLGPTSRLRLAMFRFLMYRCAWLRVSSVPVAHLRPDGLNLPSYY